ncbi:GntR family transcriptional regulator [Xanthobacter variabilis]|uniref:GntR family transcriptional regulator n=1 Tax=Xanthobacter variabilis TaxID=3119932 RepID=UPI00374FD5F6
MKVGRPAIAPAGTKLPSPRVTPGTRVALAPAAPPCADPRHEAEGALGPLPGRAARDAGKAAGAPKAPKVPKYLELKDWLLGAVLEGRFSPGTALPSEKELAQQFQVSRITVRQALDLLRESGLVTSHQGKGYFVRAISAMQDLGRLQGFGEMMEPLGIATRSEVLSAAIVEAPAQVARAFNGKRGEEVVKIERLRIAASITMSMDVSYFPLDVGRVLLDLDLQRVDIFKLIETALNIEIGFADITMSVMEADDDLCRHLPLKAGAPVIHIERLTHAMDGRPIDFENLYAPAGNHRFKARIPRW